MKKILITGATGYIGRRLCEKLLARQDLALRLLVRNRRKLEARDAGRLEVVEGDTFSPGPLARVVAGIDAASTGRTPRATALCAQNPLPEDKKHRPQDAETGPQKIQTELLLHEENGKGHKNGQGDHFLENLELTEIHDLKADPVGRHLD